VCGLCRHESLIPGPSPPFSPKVPLLAPCDIDPSLGSTPFWQNGFMASLRPGEKRVMALGRHRVRNRDEWSEQLFASTS